MAVRDYSLHGLEALADVPNHGAIVERIDIAAREATILMRSKGLCLPERLEVPLLDDVDNYLRVLVNEAVASYQNVSEGDPDSAEAWAGDDMFEIAVTGNSTGELEVEIFWKLV